MKYMSGSTVAPTVALPRGYSVILMQRGVAVGNTMMMNVLYQGPNNNASVVVDDQENSSKCVSPHRQSVQDPSCSTPPPILDKYGAEDIRTKVTVKSESPDTENDVETFAFLPVQVGGGGDGANVSTTSHEPSSQPNSISTSQSHTVVDLKDGSVSKEVRRSQRKITQPRRHDGQFTLLKDSHSSEPPPTDVQPTTAPPVKRIKLEDEGHIREGNEYQAVVEDWMERPQNCSDEDDRDICVWRDDHGCIESKELEEFCQVTRQQFGFNVADSLEVIYHSNYDMARAMEHVEEWIAPKEEPLNAEEQRLFIKSLNLHGKNFFRMQKMIPQRSVGSLVHHYYLTKKARCFGVVTDEPCPLLLRLCDEDIGVVSRQECDNCTAGAASVVAAATAAAAAAAAATATTNVHTQKRKKRRYCGICDLYFRRFKRPRPFCVPLVQSLKDPKLLVGQASTSPATSHRTPSQTCSHSCSFTTSRCQQIRRENPGEWTIEEELEALKGFRRFGKNFKAISEMLKNKTPEMIRRFYEDKQFTFRIEYLISSHNKLIKTEERLSDGEPSTSCKTSSRDSSCGAENGSLRRSHRVAIYEPVVTRMATRLANGSTTTTSTTPTTNTSHFNETSSSSLTALS